MDTSAVSLSQSIETMRLMLLWVLVPALLVFAAVMVAFVTRPQSVVIKNDSREILVAATSTRKAIYYAICLVMIWSLLCIICLAGLDRMYMGVPIYLVGSIYAVVNLSKIPRSLDFDLVKRQYEVTPILFGKVRRGSSSEIEQIECAPIDFTKERTACLLRWKDQKVTALQSFDTQLEATQFAASIGDGLNVRVMNGRLNKRPSVV